MNNDALVRNFLKEKYPHKNLKEHGRFVALLDFFCEDYIDYRIGECDDGDFCSALACDNFIEDNDYEEEELNPDHLAIIEFYSTYEEFMKEEYSWGRFREKYFEDDLFELRDKIKELENEQEME